jgi:hypothetical protein
MNQVAVLLVATISLLHGRALAYEEITVVDGGTLVGAVTLQGKVPSPKGYNLTTLPDSVYCGRVSDGRGWRLLQPFDVGGSGAFRQVVVHIEAIERGKAFPDVPPSRIEAIDCRFLPYVSVVRDEHDLVVANMDPAMHDIQAYETSHLGPRVLFNVPLPISARYPHEAGLSAHFHKHYEGTPVTQRIHMTKGRRVFSMQCGFHAYMESWALVADHPYYALTDKDGRYRLTDIPPGTYRVTVWHPYLRESYAHEVTIAPKGQTVLDMTIVAPTGRLYANQMVENPYIRYNITEDMQGQIVPTLEKQTYQ